VKKPTPTATSAKISLLSSSAIHVETIVSAKKMNLAAGIGIS
jgi:hypothetical protein